MISQNKKNDFFKLELINKKDVKNDCIKKDEGAISFISENKTYYFCVDSKKSKWKLTNKLESFFDANSRNIDVNLDSFISYYGEDMLSHIVEIIGFSVREKLSYKKTKAKQVDVNFTYDKKFEAKVQEALIKAEYQSFAAKLQDLPPNIGTSEHIADLLVEEAKKVPSVKVTVLTKKDIEKNKMGLLLAVNKGSSVEPRVVIFEYCSDAKKEKIGYVGKGICFDSGGYNLKPSASMIGMKMDMSGAAIVLSTVLAAAKAKLSTNIVAVGLLTDNRIGSKATLTESIVQSMEGATVEIENTDAEGRLVLADGLYYAKEKLQAKKLVDIATLTGAMLYSLGSYYTGMFTTDDEFANKFMQSAKVSKEDVWRLPLDCRHQEAMKSSKLADLSNVGNRANGAGSSTAAGFLNYFTGSVPYLHLDIASTESKKGLGYGVMLKTLFELAK